MRFRTTACVAALVAAGCGDGPTGPGLSPRYELAAVDGQPLPAVVWVGEEPPPTPDGPAVACEFRVTNARITFGGDGQYVATRRTLRVCVDGRPDAATNTTAMGTFTVSGDTLAMLEDGPVFHGVQAVWQGIRSGAEMRLQQQ